MSIKGGFFVSISSLTNCKAGWAYPRRLLPCENMINSFISSVVFYFLSLLRLIQYIGLYFLVGRFLTHFCWGCLGIINYNYDFPPPPALGNCRFVRKIKAINLLFYKKKKYTNPSNLIYER